MSAFDQSFGGGFNESMAQGGEKDGGRGGGSRDTTILPVSCEELCSISGIDDKIIIGGQDFTKVSIVGIVESRDQNQTGIDFVLRDSDVPEHKISDEASQLTDVVEESRVRVYGKLRSFDGKLSISAFKVLPVLDEAELQVHKLEVQVAHIYYEKKIVDRVHELKEVLVNTMFGPSSDSPLMTTNQGAQGSAMSVPATNAMPMMNNAGLSRMHAQVEQLVRELDTGDEQGASFGQVRQRLGPAVTDRQLREAFDFLASEGHIYSTSDDDHYKSTST